MRIENGEIRIHIGDDMFLAIPDDVRNELIRNVAFEEAVIEAAVNTLVTGYVDPERGWYLGAPAVARMRERVLPLMDKVAAELVRHVIRERDQAKERERASEAWAWRLWRDIEKCRYTNRDRHPDDIARPTFEYVEPLSAEAAMAEARKRWEESKRAAGGEGRA